MSNIYGIIKDDKLYSLVCFKNYPVMSIEINLISILTVEELKDIMKTDELERGDIISSIHQKLSNINHLIKNGSLKELETRIQEIYNLHQFSPRFINNAGPRIVYSYSNARQALEETKSNTQTSRLVTAAIEMYELQMTLHNRKMVLPETG
jgi:hypothetical protein